MVLLERLKDLVLGIEGKGRYPLPFLAEHLARVQSVEFGSVHASFFHYTNHASLVLVSVPNNVK
jgi:hypothetical protein